MKKLLILLLLLGASLAGVAYWISGRPGESKGAAYTTRPVEFGTLVETVSATGIVQPRQLYPVGAEAAGRVVEIAADFNDEVEEGAVLLRLDDQAPRQQREQAVTAIEAARIGIKQAEAQRDTAQKMLEREQTRPPELKRDIEVQVLANQLAAAEAALDGARNKVKQAQQALTLADIVLSKTVVRAPILSGHADGSAVGKLSDAESPSRPRRKFLVLDRKVSLGQTIGPILQGQLFTLAGDLDVVQVEAQVAEGDVSKVAKGLPADFTVASYSEADLHFAGKVSDVRLLPVNDRGAVFYKVILEAKNERDPGTGRWRLTPGLTATVDIIRRQHDGVWKLPVMALSYQPDEAKLSESARDKLRRWQERKDHEHWKPVWVVDNGAPWPVFVRVGGTSASGESAIRDLSYAEVLEWDPDLAVKPKADVPASHPQVIIAGPQGKSNGFSLKF